MCRLLEEGNVESAEVQKQRIEQLQRERRRVLEENHITHQPRFFQYELTILLYQSLKKRSHYVFFLCGMLLCEHEKGLQSYKVHSKGSYVGSNPSCYNYFLLYHQQEVQRWHLGEQQHLLGLKERTWIH